MAKQPAARRRTLNQLKVAAWPDRASAVRDLKASGVAAHGDDYELAEHKPGSWMLMPLNPPAAEPEAEPIREDVVLDNLRRKPGAKPRGAARVVAEALAPKGPSKPLAALRKVVGEAAASGGAIAEQPVKPHGKANGKAVTLPAPIAEPPSEAQSLFADVTEELAGVELGGETVEPAVKPAPFDVSPLPSSEGPFEIVIRSGDGAFPANNAVMWAVTVSRQLKVPVHVRNGHGELVRSIDVAKMKAHEKASRARGAPGRPAGSFGRPKSGESKFDRAAKLLFRDKGATAKELMKECGWPDVGQRHINRASKLNNDARIENLGDKHWRLLPAKAAR